MRKILEFPDVLRLIDERSTAFRVAITSVPSLDAQVPSCPDWTLLDLVRHLGEGRRKWAAIVAAGPAGAPPAKSVWEDASPVPAERETLLAWLAASTQELLDALREAGPDRGCWTWWGRSESPQNCGAVARHQLQEVAVHTYDAQLAVGAPQPLPDEVALDGVDEFLSTCCAGAYSWPHAPTTVEYHATEGHAWRISLAADGVRLSEPGTDPGASAQGTAGELVLTFYGRVPLDSLKLDGDRRIFDQLIAWNPDA